MDLEKVRIDKWLWAARFYKTRGLASEAIAGGKVQVNGDRAKRARPVQPGDELRIRQGPYEHHVVVRALSARRGPASMAAQLYEETSASRAARLADVSSYSSAATEAGPRWAERARTTTWCS